MITEVTRKELLPVLLDPKTEGIKKPYYFLESENGETITILSSGKNGNEFNKTIGHFNYYPGVEVYICIYGHGVAVLQRNDQEGNAKEVRVIGLRPGVTLDVPSGYGCCIHNTGKSFLIISDNSIIGKKYHKTDHIVQKQGFAYYIVEKKGEVGLEKNLHYPYHPDIIT